MLQTADWYGTVKKSLGDDSSKRTTAICLGFEESIVPLSLSQRVSNFSRSHEMNGAASTSQLNDISNSVNGPANGHVNGENGANGINGYHANDANGVNSALGNANMSNGDSKNDWHNQYPPHSVAIVGMSCRFPGAESAEKFWELLVSGASMVRQPPSDRLNLSSHRTADRPGTQFWGNFIDDADMFDHRFFKKSSREAVSWDPEKRVLLEVVYEALESAGHFSSGTSAPTDYGCYIGAVANNYYDNVACHPPTAYSMLGTSRAFFSGRISHQFGLTGPAMSIDTACSSSLVAINTACKAIQAGECSRAIAGGTNIFTSPFDYQNLAAAGFLSPTGACKPFDASADGYCRGEGVGAVVLKSLESAIEEHDNILGVIVGSAVNQNLNDAHITVPCSSSQTTVYNKVLSMANAEPSQVSYVEAHGTGTQIGDPIECQSIREAFTGPDRKEKLYFGSVKGHIGHTEASAGVAGLMKILLMMQKQTILGQANFTNLNPKIPELEADKMEIPKKCQPWTASSRLACVNSYGAAGSNAAVAVRQAPVKSTYGTERKSNILAKQPFFLSAASEQSLSAYGKKFLEFVQSERMSSTSSHELLSDVLFNLADRANHTLSYSHAQTVADLDDLEKQLKAIAASSASVQKDASTTALPTVIVFGGQEGDFIGLSEELFENNTLLRHHLDDCDACLRSLDRGSLYPAIFQRSRISDLPILHAALFAIQYSSAKCWIDCGVEPGAVIGHSFGQLSALCVAGCISLYDALRLIVGRAELIVSSWGAEPGSMISVQADRQTVTDILTNFNSDGKQGRLEVACFNHPQNHVCVGSREAVSALETMIANDAKLQSSVRTKKLKVTHGFHSMFTEPFLPALHELASSMHWQKPKFHVELCTENNTEQEPGAWLIPEHTRKPVFFAQAVDRLEQKIGACSWLEAGQRTSVISLVQTCLSSKSGSANKYYPSVVSSPDATAALADLTVELWKAGCQVRFWPHHRSQRHQYEYKALPPYQFEKTKHWLPFMDQVATKPSEEPVAPVQPSLTHEFFTFVGYKDKSETEATFLVDPESKRYKHLLEGHITSKQALAPMSLYIELVSRIAMTLEPQATYQTHVTSIESLSMKSPIGLDASRDVFYTLTRMGQGTSRWSFIVSSQAKSDKKDSIVHTTGQVGLDRRDDDVLNQTLKRYGSLIGFQRCLSILNSSEGEKMQGKHIYQAIQRLVHFDEMYQGIKSMSNIGHEAAGRVVANVNPQLGPDENLYDTPVIDSLMQFAGILVNYFCHPSVDEVLVCLGINRILTGGGFDIHAGEWIAYALLTEDTETRTECDVYIFDPKNGKLVVAFMGFYFTKTSMSVLERTLQSANSSGQATAMPKRGLPAAPAPKQSQPISTESSAEKDPAPQPKKASKRQELHELLSHVTDIPVEDITDESTLEDLEIDSLMVTEVLNEVQAAFSIEIDLNTFMFFPNLRAICAHIDSALGITEDASASKGANTATPNKTEQSQKASMAAPSTESRPSLIDIHKTFEESKGAYDRFAVETKAAGFWTEAYPYEASLVLAYVVEAFAKLGCDMARMKVGEIAPDIPHLPRHRQLVRQLFRVLEDANLVNVNGQGQFIRTPTPVDPTPAAKIFERIVPDFPQHANVHKLVQVTGSELAPCLTGDKDGLQLVFGNKANKQNLDDVYENWPLVRSATLALGEFMEKALTNPDAPGKFRILEVGAGTGGTTKYIVRHLQKLGIPFEYVFTDLSSSLVNAGKRTFKDVPGMEFSTLDIEKEPAASWVGSFHLILSTNCIHATRNLTQSLTTLRKLLRDDGVLTLVEITHNMFWLDIAVGLFEGWWLFEDGRDHAVTHETLWERCMKEAGFAEVDWTDGREPEARTIRVIAGFASSRS